MKSSSFLFASTLILLLLASCTLQIQGSAGGPQAWIDSPLNGDTLTVNTNVEVISHSSDVSGISNVELSTNTSVLGTANVPQTGQTYVLIKKNWTPTETGIFQLKVRAQNSGGQWSDYAVVTVTVAGGPAIPPRVVPLLTPLATFTPLATLPPSFTPTLSVPTLTLTENAFCRNGPDLSFPAVTAINTNETVDIKGVSQDGFWYFVFWKKFSVRCWVAAAVGQSNGNLSGVPVLVARDTPTPTRIRSVPTPTSRKP